jgi:hypothetical protein
VNTTLNAPGGSIPGFPNYSFGAGAIMNVQLSSNGTATLSGGSRTMLVVGGDPAFSDYGKIKVSYPSVTLGTTGAIASSSIIQLPQGLGFTTARGASAGRFQSAVAIPGALTLNSSFRHTALLSAGGFGNDAWAFDESRPLLFKVSACTFTTAGEIEFTSSESEWAHKAAYDQLDSDEAAGLFQTSSMRFRMSNDGHLRFTQLADTSVSFNAAPDRTARTKHAELATTKGSFISHFPSGVSCNWTGNGALSIAEGKISDGSSLRDVSLINVFYDGSCPGDACGPNPHGFHGGCVGTAKPPTAPRRSPQRSSSFPAPSSIIPKTPPPSSAPPRRPPPPSCRPAFSSQDTTPKIIIHPSFSVPRTTHLASEPMQA